MNDFMEKQGKWEMVIHTIGNFYRRSLKSMNIAYQNEKENCTCQRYCLKSDINPRQSHNPHQNFIIPLPDFKSSFQE
jgi:hypothetical protein